jgi:hypothetical protein
LSRAGALGHLGAAAIDQWATERGIEGVVWTNLKPGLKLGRDRGDYRVPSQEDVIRYLSELEVSERDAAEEYVRLAPRQIMTPYRKAIADKFNWTASGLL